MYAQIFHNKHDNPTLNNKIMMMRKTFQIALLAMLAMAPATAQTTARTFNYDAAGNRI